jgi:hypothetical protein
MKTGKGKGGGKSGVENFFALKHHILQEMNKLTDQLVNTLPEGPMATAEAFEAAEEFMSALGARIFVSMSRGVRPQDVTGADIQAIMANLADEFCVIEDCPDHGEKKEPVTEKDYRRPLKMTAPEVAMGKIVSISELRDRLSQEDAFDPDHIPVLRLPPETRPVFNTGGKRLARKRPPPEDDPPPRGTAS